MNWLFVRIWHGFLLIDDYPEEVDFFGALCTVFGLFLNLFGVFSMATINGVLTVIISLLSISWLVMRNVKEYRGFKKTAVHEDKQP